MKYSLYCPSCKRTNNDMKTIIHIGIEWCSFCASYGQIEFNGAYYVNHPSPGRMIEKDNKTNLIEGDPIEAWDDCYRGEPKKRILKKTAKSEIQRTWESWDGDKSEKMIFYSWLIKYRPYFLTFRNNGCDDWQTVHGWLSEYEWRSKE